MEQKDLSKLSDDALMKIASSDKSRGTQLASMSDDDLLAIANSDIGEGIADANKMSRGEAAKIGLERGVSLGFRPAIKGAAGGLGAFIGEIEKEKMGEGLADRIKRGISAVPGAYEEVRKETVGEEARAMADRPGYVMSGDLAGNILTSPLVALKGLKGAATLGAIQGTGRAVSEAEDLKDAAIKFGEGVGYGVAGFGAGKLLEKGAKVVAPAIGKGIKSFSQKVGDKVGKAATKVSSALTGVSEQDIKTYANNADEITKMIKASDGNVSEAADQMRERFAAALESKRAQMNSQIAGALQNSNKTISVNPIIEQLEKSKQIINANLEPEEIGKISTLIERIKSLAPDGDLSMSNANDVKRFLQEKASSSYRAPGDPASLGTQAAKSAKSGAAIARKLINEAEPVVAKANEQLSKIHDIVDDMNANLFTPGKPEAALLAAGSGGNVRNQNALRELGQATGLDMIGEAQKLSAMRTFSNPQLLPVDSTGKAVARMAAGAGIGTLTGGPLGTVLGGALTSPAALKLAIDSGRISKRALEAVMRKPVQMTEKGLAEVIQYTGSPQGQAVLNQFLNQQKVADGAIQRRMERLAKEQEK